MTHEEMEDTVAAVLCDYKPMSQRVRQDVDLLMRAIDQRCAQVLREQAAHLEAIPHEPTALTGPYWYGKGWEDAIHELREQAIYMDPYL